MHKTTSKILSGILMFALAVQCVSVVAFANVGDDVEVVCDCGGHGLTGWQVLEDGDTLTEGNYYLAETVKLKKNITILAESGEVNLCLNGKTLTGTGSGTVITVSSGTLNLYDVSGDTGMITGGNNSSGKGGGVGILAGATMNMYGGTIANNNAYYGGGVCVTGSGAVFNMYGGIIKNNTANYGGGVRVYSSASAMIQNSLITGNTATGYGNDVYMYGGSLNITDTDITGGGWIGSGNMTITDGTLDMPIYINYGTVTRIFTDAFSDGTTMDMTDYFTFLADSNSSYDVAFSYDESGNSGIFEGSVFTPDGGGDFILYATEFSISSGSKYGIDTLKYSIPVKKASSSSYYVKALANGNGTVAPEDEDVSPDSMYQVTKGGDVTFEFDADSGYEVTDVIVNGSSVGVCDEYEFENIIATMQTLEVVFAKSSSSSSDGEDEEEEAVDEEDAEIEDEEVEESDLPFGDVDVDNDNYEGIAYVYENGIMAGMTTEEFGYEYSLTRGMIAAILHRIAGEELVDEEIFFLDVTADEYYTEAIRWGRANGILAGYSETEFAPNIAITTEQFIAFLYRYATFLGMDMEVENEEDLTGYGITEYAYTAMLWAVEKDIIDMEEVSPIVEVSRGVVATALMNFMDMM